MGIAVALVLSVVALFTFAGVPLFQGIGRGVWSDRVQEGALYKPERKAIIVDTDGYAYRTADNSQMTRRDRGREQWERGALNPQSFRGWLAEVFQTPPPPAFRSAPGRTSGPVTNFTPEFQEPTVRFQSLPADSRQPAQLPSLPEIQMAAPPASAPLYQYQAEIAPAPGAPPGMRGPRQTIGIGRKIQNAIQSDESLSDAAKLTIKVTLVEGKVVLRGLVVSEETKKRVGETARKIAGPAIPVDNRLVTLNP